MRYGYNIDKTCYGGEACHLDEQNLKCLEDWENLNFQDLMMDGECFQVEVHCCGGEFKYTLYLGTEELGEGPMSNSGNRLSSKNEKKREVFKPERLHSLCCDGDKAFRRSVDIVECSDMSGSKFELDRRHIGMDFHGKTWHGDVAFKLVFPRAYALESCKNIDVASKLSQNSLAFTFRREPRGGVEQDQFDSLKAMVEGTSLVNIRDRWIWSLQSSGDFTVASIRKLIDEFTLSEVSSSTRWIKAVPIKVNVLAWKIKLDNLPTRLNISRRGMDIDSILCPTCGKAVESTRHIFFTCQIARDILHLITSWWNIPYMEVSSYEEWLVWILSLRLSINHKRIFEGVCYVTWWHIWNFRNKTIFGSESPSKAAIFDEVQSRSFYWCRYRCKAYFSWIEWLKNPHLVTL
ncbi:RNA-directed DNA polymerase, eukaryota [Tanacetum coccineum]